VSEFRRSLQSILSSKSSWTTTHRQRLMYGVRPQAARLHVAVCIFEGGAFLFTATPRTRKEFLSRPRLFWLRGRTIGALRAEWHTSHFDLCRVDLVFRMSRASLLARLPLYCSAECATPANTSLFAYFPRNLANAPLPPES